MLVLVMGSVREFGELIRSHSSSFRRKSTTPSSPTSRSRRASSSQSSAASTRPTSPSTQVPPLGMFLIVPAVGHRAVKNNFGFDFFKNNYISNNIAEIHSLLKQKYLLKLARSCVHNIRTIFLIMINQNGFY